MWIREDCRWDIRVKIVKLQDLPPKLPPKRKITIDTQGDNVVWFTQNRPCVMGRLPTKWHKITQITIYRWFLITRRSQVQVLSPQPHCATKKDIAPKKPETMRFPGFFRARFWLHKKKISSRPSLVWWGLELNLTGFEPLFWPKTIINIDLLKK